MARVWYSVTFILAIVLAAFYQIQLRPIVSALGFGRVLEPVGNTNCKAVPELQACEKIVLHRPSGLLYLACSTPSSRSHWMPTMSFLDERSPERSENDYIATYDPATSTVKRLAFSGFDSPRGFSAHGMDVVSSPGDPNVLFVYAVNNRRPLHGLAKNVGADSVIEIFRTTARGTTLTHVKTLDDPVIDTPNDITALPDGKSFYFTNDHGSKVGLLRHLELLGLAQSSVGYCHIDEGCKTVISKLLYTNGIARSQNDTFYVGNCGLGEIRVLERQADNSLVLTDVIALDRIVDNLSLDEDGALWAAGIPNGLEFLRHGQHPDTHSAPSSAMRVTLNTGRSAFFGEKFKVDKIFEDDGLIASGSTTAVFDSNKGLLFLSGLASPHLTVCDLGK